MSKPSIHAASVEFRGKKAEQERAERVFGLFRARGMLFAADAPISLTPSNILEALDAIGDGAGQKALENALDANDHIFQRVERGDEIVYVTTRQGIPPRADGEPEEDLHMLPERFATPEPPREHARPRQIAADERTAGLETPADRPVEFPPDSWQAAVAAALREAGQPESVSISEAIIEQPELADVIVEPSIGIEPEPVVEETVVAEEPARPVVEAEPEAPEEIDIVAASDEELAEAIDQSLRDEPGAVRWGDTWMLEENVPALSADDLGKIQEILGAADEAVSDYALVKALRGDETPGSDAFELERFAVNYRMSREMRLFEFVGAARQALWMSGGLTPIGSDTRKASEFGQDYRFLLDYRAADPDLEPGIVEHVLTFYEHHHGVLPLNANTATIMPRAAFNDQRATRLSFESPQTFESFEVELRYPTSSRGGYLIGFEEFFTENLVPGAVLTIEAVREHETHFVIEYFQISRQDRKLLQFNERRNRYVFQTTTYFCATQDDMLIDDNHFERLADVEPLSEDDRRRPDTVVARTFERVGAREENGGEVRYRAHIVDILAAANVERPISEPFLRDILTGGGYPEFIADAEEDVFVYVAPAA